MEIGPIWRSMMRNKTGAVLIALQIAVTMAIMVNASLHHAGTCTHDVASQWY